MVKSMSRIIVQMPMLLTSNYEAVPNFTTNENGNEARSRQKNIYGDTKFPQNLKQESLLVTHKCHSEAYSTPQGKVKKKTLVRNESWGLMNGDESMPSTPTIKVQGNLKEGEIGADAAINSIITDWKKDQSTLSTIAFYLTNEPL
jgi:hypothetical protein